MGALYREIVVVYVSDPYADAVEDSVVFFAVVPHSVDGD